MGRATRSRCPKPARALFVATLARATARRPVVIAVPTGVEAERHRGRPARVSSATTRSSCSRRGRRCRSSGCRPRPRRWAGGCASCGGCAPAASICPRSSSRRCARSCNGSVRTSKTSNRSSSRPVAQIDRDELVARLVADRVPARVPGRSARRDRRARLDRRRVPGHRRSSGAHRSVGRRGRSAVGVLRCGPALDGSIDRGVDLPGARGAADRRGAGACRASSCTTRRGGASSGNDSPRAARSTGWSRGCRGSPTTSTC